MRFIGSLLDFDICVELITRDPGRLVDNAEDVMPPRDTTMDFKKNFVLNSKYAES